MWKNKTRLIKRRRKIYVGNFQPGTLWRFTSHWQARHVPLSPGVIFVSVPLTCCYYYFNTKYEGLSFWSLLSHSFRLLYERSSRVKAVKHWVISSVWGKGAFLSRVSSHAYNTTRISRRRRRDDADEEPVERTKSISTLSLSLFRLQSSSPLALRSYLFTAYLPRQFNHINRHAATKSSASAGTL